VSIQVDTHKLLVAHMRTQQKKQV